MQEIYYDSNFVLFIRLPIFVLLKKLLKILTLKIKERNALFIHIRISFRRTSGQSC